jgi:predicted acylesterase/phospholipase RssA
MRFMKPNINRALILQGGGSLGAYEAGTYKALTEDLLAYVRSDWGENVPLFHIISGTSIGAINAALLVSYVKENKTWDGSAERLVEFWEYLSTQPSVDNITYLTSYWDSWRRLDRRIASENLPEDISALRNLFLREFLTYLYPKHQCLTISFLIHQIRGICMTTDR